MSSSNIKILCERFRWNTNTAKKDINFFSSVTPLAERLEVDLIDFVMNDVVIVAENEDVDDKFNYVPQVSKVDLKLHDAELSGSSRLRDFFLYDKDKTFYKWKVRILFNNSLMFQGVINRGSFTEPFGFGNDKEIISVTVSGWLKEMAEYYKNIPLKNPSEIEWSYTVFGGLNKDKLLLILLYNDVFPAIPINQWNIPLNYYIALNGIFAVNNNANHFNGWVKTGYERIWQTGENRWDWWQKTLNGMNWQQEINYVNNQPIITVRPKYPSPTAIVDGNMVMSYTVKETDSVKFDYVIIVNGAMDGGDSAFNVIISGFPSNQTIKSAKGERLIIASNTPCDNYRHAHFSTVNYGGSNYELLFANGYEFKKFRAENDTKFNVVKFSKGIGSISEEQRELDKSKILFINAGSTSPYAWRVDLSNKINSPVTIGETDINPFDLVYFGSYADAIYKRNLIGSYPHVYPELTYQMYANSPQFRFGFNNMLTGTTTMPIEVDYIGVWYGGSNGIKFFGGDPVLNKDFIIVSYQTDLTNETTKFNLIARN